MKRKIKRSRKMPKTERKLWPQPDDQNVFGGMSKRCDNEGDS